MVFFAADGFFAFEALDAPAFLDAATGRATADAAAGASEVTAGSAVEDMIVINRELELGTLAGRERGEMILEREKFGEERDG